MRAYRLEECFNVVSVHALAPVLLSSFVVTHSRKLVSEIFRNKPSINFK